MPNPSSVPKPPRAAEWLLMRLYPDRGAYSTAGDMNEEFVRLADEKGTARARRWYVLQTVRSVPYPVKEFIIWRIAMFKNYLKIAWRHMRRQKAFSIINIAGLAISMACALLIVLWIRDELSFDKFHVHKNDIYRITAVGKEFSGFSSPAPFAPAIAAEIPEVAEAARVARIFGRVYLKAGERAFYESDGICADPSLFRIFTFPLTKGTAEEALAKPDGVILGENLARKYFGGEDPINQTILLEGRWLLTVRGIMADIPRNSHFRFDFVLSIAFAEAAGWWGMNWGDFNFMTYIRTVSGPDEKALESKLNEVALAHKCPQVVHKQLSFSIQRLSEIYLNPLRGYDLPLGNGKVVYLFSLIAVLIALIAAINFINLTTARAEKRAKEVGLRKVVGAERRQIIGQFFGESMLVTFLALILSVLLAKIAMPIFNVLTGKQLAFRLFDPGLLLSLAAISGFIGLLAGAFPSLYLSSFRPIQIVKGRSGGRIKGGVLRRILVVSQFAVSVVLILATIVVTEQMRYIRRKSWNSGQDVMLYIPFKENIGSQYDRVRSRLLEHPSIAAVGAKDCLPTLINNKTSGVFWDGKTADQDDLYMETIRIDYHYLKTVGLEIVEGRGFSPEFAGDVGRAYILSEKAARLTRLVRPVGKTFRLYNEPGQIVGIVKDSFFQSFRQEQQAQVYYLFRDLPAESADSGVILIRVKGAAAARGLPDVIAHLKTVWESVNATAPFEYAFFDQAIAAQYASDQRQGKLFGVFAFLAVFISCLGLLGLASFIAEQRTKEIGIRKVLGASASNIVRLLTLDFTRSVLIANLIAWPVAYLAMNAWLRNFAIRPSLPLWIFAAVGGATLLLSWMTVGMQTFRSARTNPAEAVRVE